MRDETKLDVVFSSFRHELLNDLQLVSGYLQMNKPAGETLNKLDIAVWRIHQTGRLFNINNPTMSCVLYEMWAEAQSLGINLVISLAGKWDAFSQQWQQWQGGVEGVWIYYKGLANSTGLHEIALTLKEEATCWRITFSAEGAPVTATALPEKLQILLVNDVRIRWEHNQHRIDLEVAK